MSEQLERWWTHKYKRPVNDPELLSRTYASLFEERLDDWVQELVEIEEEIETATGPVGQLHRRGNDLRAALGIAGDTIEDPLAEEWIAATEAGQPLPKSFFDALPADLRALVEKRKKPQNK